MITRIFQKLVLDFKHNSLAFVKYYHSIDHFSNISYRNLNTYLFSENKVLSSYISNRQNSSKTQETLLCQQTHIPIPNGPLCCKNNTILARTNSVSYYPVTVNNIRQYSNLASATADRVALYNNGIIKHISESSFVECIMDALRTLHQYTGLPWWATIILATFCTRIFTFPLAVHQHQVIANIKNIRDEMKETTEHWKRMVTKNVTTSKWSAAHAKRVYRTNVRRKWKELIIRDNCHPAKVWVIFMLEAPIWLGLSLSLRNFCFMLPKTNDFAHEDYLQFTTGGFGWMKNLTEIDHLYILPILFGLLSFAMIEINYTIYGKDYTRLSRIYMNFIRILTVCLVPILAYLPSSVILFWTANRFCTLSQILLLLSPKIRRLGRISKVNLELQHPYATLYEKLKKRLHL
ncbi:cytochrome c oxidase assembly protein COX18, mitochondrial [Ptiloglossa arizonensis]|uniref:cytochrome c oxidase assembly protein COX18, mitochondrial n=1 Tax=Ptiloglossa arizonensis TaxID=3350558 RepID=UPI003FA0F58C